MKVTNLLTQADRDMFDRIDRDCIAMHVPTPPKTFIELSVIDGDGVEVERYTDRAHSWVRNAYNYLWQRFNGGNTVVGSTYGAGSLRTVQSSGSLWSFLNVLFNNSSEEAGPIVGTGSAAESMESYSLTTKILNGTTSGKLTHNTTTFSTPSYDGVSKKWTSGVSKIFNNNSGAEITVSEVGLAGYESGQSMLMCRDVLASPVTVPNAGQLTVTYTIEMTFPA